jgi:hypothetical protein
MEEQATAVVEASTEYVGRWNLLVSTTNWEKGRIICQWREALEQADAPAGSCSDEAWSRQVGNVTPQHVGRLRRVFDRFGEVFDQYTGLYWSHFQAALDWPDAEMYLQGAVESDWSVSQMRNQRWEAIGGPPESQPRDGDIVASDLDEDVSAANDSPLPAVISDTSGEVHAAHERNDDDEDEDAIDTAMYDEDSALPDAMDSAADEPAAPPLRPFESLPPLPPDLNEALDLFRLAILNHKVSGWREISRNDVLSVLESLRQLALAPAE